MCCLLQALEPDQYADSFRPDLMESVAQWVRGVRFKDMAGLTSIYEVRGGMRV